MSVERFPHHLDARKSAGPTWELLAPFTYISRRYGTITVPAGFVTDLASIPRLARWYVSRDGDHTKPAVVHDWLYGRASIAGHPSITRADADRIFLEALKARGVRSGLATVMYWAVRLGGWSTFRND